MFAYRLSAVLVGAAIFGGGVSAEVHMALSGTAPSGGFVPVGVLAGIGLGIMLTAFIPSGTRATLSGSPDDPSLRRRRPSHSKEW